MERTSTTPFVLCDNNFDVDGDSWLFTDLHDAIEIDDLRSLEQTFLQIEAYIDAGYYVAGYLTYELSAAFGLKTHATVRKNFGYLGIFSRRELLDATQVDTFLETASSYTLKKHLNFTYEAYRHAFEAIQAALRVGDTYQVNYTFQYLLEQSGCIKSLYTALRQAQPVSYGALLCLPDCNILSRSPELFFRKTNTQLLTQPMKGTARRSADAHEDAQILNQLQSDPKTRSENMMIVDLLRNDFGRIAKTGSVRVENIMEAQTYSTVHQIVSMISCEIQRDLPFLDILRAVFPCGSVTGAPKKSTMDIINRLEPSPRGVYTGAIGYITPERNMCFNVPIRTLELDATGQGGMRIGSGLVAASDLNGEWDECLLKSKFLDIVCRI